MHRRRRAIYLVLAAVALVTLFPFIWMLITSFKSPGALFRLPPSFAPDLLFSDEPFSNYAVVLGQRNFLRYALNSSIVAGSAAAGQLLTCSLAGFAFARFDFAGKRILFAVLIATLFIPNEVTIIPEFLLMSRLNWLDTWAPLIVPSLLVGAFGTFLLTEYFKTIPPDYEEAARLDGANALQIYWHVFLPMARPALASLFVIAFINNWNELLRPVLYISSPELRTLPLALMAFETQYEADWTRLMAGAVISILPLIGIYLAAQKHIVRGFIASGIR